MTRKILAVLISIFLLLGNPIPLFAVSAELARDDRQQFVPVVSYDPAANDVPSAATSVPLTPSGVAIQNTNPLSISTASSSDHSPIKTDRVFRSIAVTRDTIPPTGAININSGAAYATSRTVILNLYAKDSGSGVVAMSSSTDGKNWTAKESYKTSKQLALPAGDGRKTVYVKYFDRAGNASRVYSDTIILDMLPPTGTIKVNSGAQFINQTAVTLNLSAADAGSGLSKMRFSTNGTTWGATEVYAATKAWTFSSGDGAKKVYVQFQDKTGKWSAVASVAVTLDTAKPTGTITINSGAAYTNSTNVTLNLSGADNASGISQMSFSTDGATWSVAEAYATSKAFPLPAEDGTKTVYVKYFDKAGNASLVYSKAIILDTVPPAVVLDPATPQEITTTSLAMSYTVDGAAKTILFESLIEGENILAITETDLAGNQTIVNWTVMVNTAPWIPAVSNANYSFRVTQDASGYRLELRYNPGGGITLLSSGTGPVPDTFDVTPDGSKVIYEGGGTARVERIGEPWTARTVEGDLTQILYYNDYVMLKTDRTYPSGTVIRTSTGIRISTFNPEFISTFYLTVVTPGAGFFRNDSLSIAVQPEYDQASGQYYAHIYSLYGGNDYSSSVRTVSLGNETPGSEGGTFTRVDAVVAPGGQTVLAIGLDSPTFNKTFLVNQNITFDGAATAVTYQNNIANYTVRDNDGSTRTVRFDLNKLEIVPELPAVELVQPLITQVPNPLNQFTLKFDQAMRGVRYEVQFRTSLTSGNWQTAGEFVADHYGEVTWQDPAQDRGSTVFYRVVAHEITTAADLLTQINMLYFDSEFGLVDPTHEYPLEGWLQRRITQPSNFGFYANLLASIAAGDLVTATISKTEAIRRLDVMMTHLLEDQQTLGYRGLLPWLGYYNGDWQRMDDIYGRQVSFEDNTNMTAGLAVAYGALLEDSLTGNTIIHGNGGVLDKIDSFLANQRDGYVAMYNEANQTFARTMVIADGHLEGTVDLFGAESMGPLLFLILQYGDAFPASTYNKLHFSTSTYTMQDGTTRTVVEPFSGAFQMYWPALFMPEAGEPDLRAMLETYTDVQLDYASRNNQPGILSASYDVGSYDLLSRYVGAFSWAGDAVNGIREGDGSFHVTSPTSIGIGVYFADDSKFVFEGSTMQLRYSSQTVVPNARLEFKQMIDGVLQIVHVENLSLENTGGEVRTLTLTLPENGTLGDLKEVAFAVSGGTGPLDLTFHQINTDRIQYNFSLGINEIAMNGVMETTPSTYNLGAAYMFRPAGVEALLQRLITEHPELITSHGLWEGINMTSGKVVKEQVFNNVVSFTLGMAGTGGSSMTRYLEQKGLTSKLQSIWDPQAPVSLTNGTSGNFEWNGFKGTAWHLPESVRASGRELRISYQSSTSVTGVKLELKHAGSNDPAYSVQIDLPATGSGPGEYVITIPESYLYWYITDAVVLFPEAQGYPDAKITGMTLVPAARFVPPAGVEVGVEYTGEDLEALLRQYAPQIKSSDLVFTRSPSGPVWHLMYTHSGNLAIGFHAYYENVYPYHFPQHRWFSEMDYFRPGEEVINYELGDILIGMALNESDDLELWFKYGDRTALINKEGEISWIPKQNITPPDVVLNAAIPSLINTKTLTANYTVNGVAKSKLFEGLAEGLNVLTITETDAKYPFIQTSVSFSVTVDTIAPVVVLDPQTPTWIASSSIVVYYTLDGVLKQKTFTDLVVGVNQLAISEVDPAGNRTTVNFNVSRPQGTDFLKGQITTFALNGGNAAASWDSGVLHVTSSNFKGVGVAAILNPTSINVRQVQISYSSLTPVPNARIEYKARDASGKLITVKTQYLSLQNTGGIVKTVTTDLIFSGYPAIDEIVFVTDGAGTSTLDMKIYGFAGF